MNGKFLGAVISSAACLALVVACSEATSVSDQLEEFEQEQLAKRESSSSVEDENISSSSKASKKKSSSSQAESSSSKKSSKKSSSSEAEETELSSETEKSKQSSDSDDSTSASSESKDSADSVDFVPTVGTGGAIDDFGTCKPSKTPINKGETVDWTFTRGAGLAPTNIMNASFDWYFEGAAPAEFSGTGTKGITAAGITYSNSGKFGATLVVAKPSGAGATLQCEPLQVNGAPITGCKCAATNATANLKGIYEVDIAEAQPVEYAVTGCSSMGANITSYTWMGATGDGTSASASIAAKGEAVRPTVTVTNDGNTEIQVECPQVVAIDSRLPDYVFELENASQIPNTALDVKDGGCMNITGTWGNAGYNPSVQVLCSMKATSTPVSF
uniref:hypothetical protein n=1 Tax=Fibrobacter sp. TaxID=35828 RepID=UPI003890D654